MLFNYIPEIKRSWENQMFEDLSFIEKATIINKLQGIKLFIERDRGTKSWFMYGTR